GTGRRTRGAATDGAGSPAPVTGTGSSPRTPPGRGRPGAATRTEALRTPPRSRRRSEGEAGRTSLAPPAGRRSGAVPAEHPVLVLQLASVLHEVAVLAYELGGLGRDHLDGKGLETLLALHGEYGVVLFLLLDGLPILLLGDQLLEAGLHLALAVRRGRGRALLL